MSPEAAGRVEAAVRPGALSSELLLGAGAWEGVRMWGHICAQHRVPPSWSAHADVQQMTLCQTTFALWAVTSCSGIVFLFGRGTERAWLLQHVGSLSAHLHSSCECLEGLLEPVRGKEH